MHIFERNRKYLLIFMLGFLRFLVSFFLLLCIFQIFHNEFLVEKKFFYITSYTGVCC